MTSSSGFGLYLTINLGITLTACFIPDTIFGNLALDYGLIVEVEELLSALCGIVSILFYTVLASFFKTFSL